MADETPRPSFDTTVPHSARVWNYWLGKDNFPADREFGDKAVEAYPKIVGVARASRAFLSRVVRYLAGEADVRQFLDIGVGLPGVDNTHGIAQRVDPEGSSWHGLCWGGVAVPTAGLRLADVASARSARAPRTITC